MTVSIILVIVGIVLCLAGLVLGVAFTFAGQSDELSLAESARARRKRKPTEVEDYRHDATRKNTPPLGMVQYEVVNETPQEHYAYDPHLSPQLI